MLARKEVTERPERALRVPFFPEATVFSLIQKAGTELMVLPFRSRRALSRSVKSSRIFRAEPVKGIPVEILPSGHGMVKIAQYEPAGSVHWGFRAEVGASIYSPFRTEMYLVDALCG